MMTSTMSGEIPECCKDCLITCIPTGPIDDEVDEDRTELGEPDSELKLFRIRGMSVSKLSTTVKKG